MDREAARQSVHITRQFFSEDSCAMAERCVSGTGERRLLRFDGVIWNVGESDFFLGDPRESDQFEYASCHGHYHLQDIAEYMLLDPGSGETLVVGRKQGFCMLDSQRINSDQPPRYNCDFQGLSAGWADVYESTLDCQWLDITDVPPGEYVMRIRVNPSGTFEESDYSNNAAEFPVSIP